MSTPPQLHPEQRTQQSRPTRDKKSNLFRRLLSGHGRSSSMNQTSSSAYGSSSVFRFSAGSCRAQQRIRRNNAMSSFTTSSNNLMHWLQEDCPLDLLPLILAFAGPQTMAAFARTNRYWNEVFQKESTWKTVCEELYKWKEGDPIPLNWKDFYKYTPCVPTDYSTVNQALAVVRTARAEQIRSIKILLRPGRYIIREGILVQAPSSVRVQIETMEMPDSFQPVIETSEEAEPPKRRRKSGARIRSYLSCRSVDVVETEQDDDILLDFDETPSSTSVTTSSLSAAANANNSASSKRAKLILRTRRHNEPIVRVRQGCCILKNLDLCHVSHGIDIWNGNAAIQVQPPIDQDGQPMMVLPAPTAILDGVDISSASGRGIVNIDGGLVAITRCYVHDCAATGIYVGGPGSRAKIEETDVVRNGNGNTQHRRGIARGHSGIYLEQGHAHIRDCNISQNSLTGISAVSPDNAILNLEESDLVSNGTFQLEMPAAGTNAFRHSSTQNNNMLSSGVARTRSGLNFEEG